VPRYTRIALLIVVCAAGGNSWASASDSYQAGIRAFNALDYEQALAQFIAARQAGMESPTLHYNLGATYYKLGKYRPAAAEFSSIGEDPNWGALAQYNLGLISEKLGERDAAQRHFETASREASSAKLRRMADAKLAETSGPRPAAAAADSDWSRYFSLGAGYDDNVILSNDATLVAASGNADYFADAAAFVSGYLAGNYADGWRLDLGATYRGYTDLDDFDFGTGFAGAAYNRLVGGWHLQAGAIGMLQLAGGDHYTSQATFRARAYHRLGRLGLRLTNDFGLIKGASDFDYLSGIQNRLTLELIGQLDQVRLRGGYRFEINDRDDLATADEFFSYSPTRHDLFGVIEMPLSKRLSGEVRADFQSSDYADDNVEIEVDNTVTVAARDADRLSVTVHLGFRITSKWQLFGEFEHSNNDSNFDRYSYNSNRYMLGIESAR